MLTITSPLARQTTIMAFPGKGFSSLEFQATVTDTNPALSRVAASLDWNNGTPPIDFGPGPKPLVIDATRTLSVGSYYLTLTAWNFADVPGTISAYYQVEVQPSQVVPQRHNFLFGPILPLDNGAPNASTWNFDLGTNISVLASSVKMLLITTKGERIMQPTYGTLLRKAVFEPNDGSVTATVQQEITSAIAQFEPRVSLESLAVKRISARELAVSASFLSKMNQSSFSLAFPVVAQ
jgi:uncharacterized protein